MIAKARAWTDAICANVAEVDGKWVALFTFSGATPKLKGRDK